MLFVKHAGQVASPIAPRPAHALLQVLGIVLQDGLHLAFRVVLHVCLPAVRKHPSGDEIVVVCIESIFAKPPGLVGEVVGEIVVAENFAAVRHCAAGHAGNPTIYKRRCCTVKIPSFKVQSTEKAPDSLGGKERVFLAPQTLAGHHSPILLILKGRQHPSQRVSRPGHIVVGEDDDFRVDFGNCASHLSSLVGIGHGETAQTGVLRSRHFGDSLLGQFEVQLDGHQDDFPRLILKYRFNRVL